ncbi:MAG: hypothetical protein ACO2O0_08525 [Desulfurococcales archaeon]|jgi:hypothetical protein
MPGPDPYQPEDAITVDVNERKMVYGDHMINKEKGIEIDRVYR